MGVACGIPQVIDGDDLDCLAVVVFIECSEDVAADAAKAIDGDSDGHGTSLVVGGHLFPVADGDNVVNIAI